MERTVNQEVRTLVENLRKKCESGVWEENIKSLNDLKKLVARVIPQVPLSSAGASSSAVEPVTQQEAKVVTQAFEEHVHKLQKAATDENMLKRDLRFIIYNLSILVHVLGEDYKCSETTVIDDAAHTEFKSTLRQGWRTVFDATKLRPAPRADIAVDRFVRKCVIAHALVHELNYSRKHELPYHRKSPYHY